MDILGLGYVAFESQHAAAWRDYGPDVLGMEVSERPGDAVYLRMDEQDHRLVVRPGDVERIAYLGWELRHRPAWDDAVAHARASGMDVTVGDEELEADRAVHQVAWFKGPDQLRHELYYGRTFHPDFRPGRAMRGGFVTGKYGLGHVVVGVPELTDELHRWCLDVMGFRWFGHGPRREALTFYRPKLNPRTHSIAYGATPGKRGLHHLGIEVEQLDDVGVAYDLVQEAGLPLYRTLGRHTQDPVVSFYSFTPSGWIVEYIWGAEDMPEETFQEKKPQQLSVWGHKLASGDRMSSTLLPAT